MLDIRHVFILALRILQADQENFHPQPKISTSNLGILGRLGPMSIKMSINQITSWGQMDQNQDQNQQKQKEKKRIDTEKEKRKNLKLWRADSRPTAAGGWPAGSLASLAAGQIGDPQSSLSRSKVAATELLARWTGHVKSNSRKEFRNWGEIKWRGRRRRKKERKSRR